MNAIKLLITDTSENQWSAVEERLTRDPGFECVGRVNRLVELLLAIRSFKADAVVFFAGTDEQGILSHVFAEFPDLTVLTLSSSGEAFIEERCPVRRKITFSSPDGIIEALREAVTQPCDGPEKRLLN